MNTRLIGGIASVAALLALYGAQRSARFTRQVAGSAVVTVATTPAAATDNVGLQVLYWKAPDGTNNYSLTARKTSLSNSHNDPISANMARMNKVPISRAISIATNTPTKALATSRQMNKAQKMAITPCRIMRTRRRSGNRLPRSTAITSLSSPTSLKN